MEKAKPVSPISDVLWHFTGGPRWDKKLNRQEINPKPAKEAFASFCSILQSKELRIGGYHEVVRIAFPERKIPKKRAIKSKEITIKKHVIEVNTPPVCCLADIPLGSLAYHAQRYGLYAIGFHRAAALREGFNPVFYAVDDQPIINNFWGAYNTLENFTADEVIEAAQTVATDTEQAFAEIEEDNGHRDMPDVPDSVFVEDAAANLEAYVADAYASISRAMAFIKTFERSEFSTIYAEREWRSINPFRFRDSDIAALIVPEDRTLVPGRAMFTSKFLPKLRLSKKISIKVWPDFL